MVETGGNLESMLQAPHRCRNTSSAAAQRAPVVHRVCITRYRGCTSAGLRTSVLFQSQKCEIWHSRQHQSATARCAFHMHGSVDTDTGTGLH